MIEVICIVVYIVMLCEAEKIRNSKYWFIWWILSILILARSAPLFDSLFKGVDVDLQINYIFGIVVFLLIVVGYINAVKPFRSMK